MAAKVWHWMTLDYITCYHAATVHVSGTDSRPTPPVPVDSPDSVETLIQQCLRGDQAAWDRIVQQHWRKVFNVAYKFVGRHDEAEDLTQDIFLKVFRSLSTFDRRANFQTWLISVSRNLCIDHYRSVRKERESIDRAVDTDTLAPVAPDAGPVAALEHQDRVVLLRQALERRFRPLFAKP